MITTANPTAMKDEPTIALPTTRLMTAVLLPCAAIGAVLSLVSLLGLWSTSPAPWITGAVVVALCTMAGLLAIQPWKPRPVSRWVSIWMAQTVVRMLATPVLAYLLYSATPLREGSATPFFLAVGACYLAAILSEAGVVSRFLKRSTPAR